MTLGQRRSQMIGVIRGGNYFFASHWLLIVHGVNIFCKVSLLHPLLEKEEMKGEVSRLREYCAILVSADCAGTFESLFCE